MTATIKPTVGRVLHFFPSTLYMAGRKLAFGDPSQPLAAVIAYVHSDKMVNLTVWDQNGLQFDVCSVQLVQDGDTVPLGSFYAAWMDYQKGQAAKTDELEVAVTMLTGKAEAAPLLKSDLGRLDEASGEDETLVRIFLPADSIVKVEGIPLKLSHDAVVLTHPCNVPLIFPPRTARPAESSE